MMFPNNNKAVVKKLTLEYSINGKMDAKEFVLSGFWESDAISPASLAYVSEPFIKTALAGFEPGPEKRGSGTGMIFADVMFANGWNIEKNMQTVISESGYSLDQDSPDYISYGVNWAYLGSSFEPDPTSIGVVAAAVGLIIFTGYLIIYNIFQISVVRDIRFYGLLNVHSDQRL